jgi:hypothetical protein
MDAERIKVERRLLERYLLQVLVVGVAGERQRPRSVRDRRLSCRGIAADTAAQARGLVAVRVKEAGTPPLLLVTAYDRAERQRIGVVADVGLPRQAEGVRATSANEQGVDS